MTYYWLLSVYKDDYDEDDTPERRIKGTGTLQNLTSAIATAVLALAYDEVLDCGIEPIESDTIDQ